MIWRLIDVFRRRRLDADLDAQLAYHLDGLEAEFRSKGLSADEARAAARRAMGGLTQVQDAYRDQLTVPVLETLWQDVRYGWRAMRHNVTYTAVVVLTLALGIGANTAVFGVIDHILLEPLPYPQAEELVAFRQIATGAERLASSSGGLNLSPSMYVTYAENNRTFQSMGVWVSTISTVTGVGDPEQVRVIGISDGLLQALKRSTRSRSLASVRRPGRSHTAAAKRVPGVDPSDAQLRVLAETLRRRPIRDRAHDYRRFATERNRRCDAARIQDRQR